MAQVRLISTHALYYGRALAEGDSFGGVSPPSPKRGAEREQTQKGVEKKEVKVT